MALDGDIAEDHAGADAVATSKEEEEVTAILEKLPDKQVPGLTQPVIAQMLKRVRPKRKLHKDIVEALEAQRPVEDAMDKTAHLSPEDQLELAELLVRRARLAMISGRRGGGGGGGGGSGAGTTTIGFGPPREIDEAKVTMLVPRKKPKAASPKPAVSGGQLTVDLRMSNPLAAV